MDHIAERPRGEGVQETFPFNEERDGPYQLPDISVFRAPARRLSQIRSRQPDHELANPRKETPGLRHRWPLRNRTPGPGDHDVRVRARVRRQGQPDRDPRRRPRPRASRPVGSNHRPVAGQVRRRNRSRESRSRDRLPAGHPRVGRAARGKVAAYDCTRQGHLRQPEPRRPREDAAPARRGIYRNGQERIPQFTLVFASLPHDARRTQASSRRPQVVGTLRLRRDSASDRGRRYEPEASCGRARRHRSQDGRALSDDGRARSEKHRPVQRARGRGNSTLGRRRSDSRRSPGKRKEKNASIGACPTSSSSSTNSRT